MRRTTSTVALFSVIFLLCLLTPVAAYDINVTVNETGKIVSFYDEYYIYQLNGSLTIINPSNTSLFNIEIPLYLSTLDIRTNYSKPGNYLTPGEMFIYTLPPNSSETFYYEIYGISTEDLSPDGDAILANAIESRQPKLYSNLFGSLLKAEMEDPAYTGRSNARLISVHLSNPTEYSFVIDKVEVIKTNINDPNAEVDKWVFTNEKSSLQPLENWAFDFIDENASEGQIYWLTTDIYIDAVNLIKDANITRYNQEDLFEVVSNATLNETINTSIPFLSDRVYLRKLVSSTLVVPGDLVNITVLVNNLEPKEIDIQVFDIFPDGFDVVSVEDGIVNDHNLSWNITLSSGTAKRLRYQLRYVDDDALGLDYYRPAHLIYDGIVVYSQNLPFVRKYIPQKRLFVQKNVKFLAGDTVQIRLSLQNLGESPLENIMIKEYLLSSAEFREISQQPLQRGLWKIDELNQSSTWEVTYITDKMSLLNNMPEIYGISQGSILQTIILSNLITSKLSLLSTNSVEIIGIVILALLLGLYFVPPSYFSRVKRRQSKDLHLMTRELDDLRRKTDKHNRSLAHVQKTSPVLRSRQGEQTQHKSPLREPGRVARHSALEETAGALEDVKKDVSQNDDEKPPAA